MPRLRLAESSGKRHKSTAPKTNEFGISNDGLDDFDFTYDEFDFVNCPDGVLNSASSTSSSKVENPYQTNSTSSPTIRSPISSKKKTTKKPKSSGYTKLFNSSTDMNDENKANLNVETKKKASATAGDKKSKKQRVSFEDSEDDSLDAIMREGTSQDKANGEKRGKETPSILSHDDLSDTDEESSMPTNKKPGAKSTKAKSTAKKPLSTGSKSKCTKDALSGLSSDSDNEVMKTAKKPRAKPTKSKGAVNKNRTANSKAGTTRPKEDESAKSHPRLKSSTPITNSYAILPHRAIAVDNRALPSLAGDSTTRQFLSRLGEFIMEALDRDVLTSSPPAASVGVGKTVIVSLVNTGTVSVQSSFLFDGASESSFLDRRNWISSFLTSINCGFGDLNERGESSIGFDYGEGSVDFGRMQRGDRKAEGFVATDSWTYFGDMVEASRNKVVSAKITSGYALSIFTTDASLFADTNPDSHMSGFNQFQKRISKAAVRKAVLSVTIVITDTTSVTQAMTAAREFGSFLHNDEPSESALPNRLQILQCINLIRRRIQELPDTSMKIQLEFMDGTTVDFQTLLQAWTRESLSHTYLAKSGIDSINGKLQFELPETIDGTVSSISLDLQYTVLPDHIDSQSTAQLVKDMQLLSSSAPHSVEVLQTVPLSSVDSSLIYGVPMYARPALDHDMFQHNQMKILVRQLWKYLSRNDVALVLKVRREVNGGEQEVKDVSKAQNHCQDELFLLISQIAVQKQSIRLNPDSSMQTSSAFKIMPDHNRKGESPCNGILYRYATKNQILHFGNEDPDPKAEEEDSAEEVAEYADYIERSMDMLTSSGLNPFLVGENHSLGGSGFFQSQDSSIQ